MSIQEEVLQLKEIPLFAEIDDSKVKLIAFASAHLRYQKGDVVFSEGDSSESIYIILSGEVDVRINVPDGQVTVATMGKNAIFGELAVFCNVPRTASIVANSDLETLRIEKTLFIQLLEDFPKIALSVLRVLGSRLIQNGRIISQLPKEQAEKIMSNLGMARTD